MTTTPDSTIQSDIAQLMGDRPAATDDVPEFLWYDLALEALRPEAQPATRLAALRLLARVPRSWYHVVMAALTSADLGVQLAALEALTGHARLDPERLVAFERLGDLPGWHPTAREAWAAAWRELAAAYEAARREQTVELLEARVAQLSRENDDLLDTGSRLQVELELARRSEHEALERIASLDAANARLEAELADTRAEFARVREALEAACAAAEAARRGAESARWAAEHGRELAEAGRRRWVAAAAAAMVVAIGPLAAIASGGVMAFEPPRALVVPLAPIATPVAARAKAVHALPAPARPLPARPAGAAPVRPKRPADPIPAAVRAKF